MLTGPEHQLPIGRKAQYLSSHRVYGFPDCVLCEGSNLKAASQIPQPQHPYRPFPRAVCIGQLQPFVRDIMMVECTIACTSFRELQGVEPLLTIGSLLPLKREPANEHDALAIMIFDEKGQGSEFSFAIFRATLRPAGRLKLPTLLQTQMRRRYDNVLLHVCGKARIVRVFVPVKRRGQCRQTSAA